MDIDVDRVRGHLHGQEGDGIAAHHQQPAIRLAEGMLERPVADVPAVQEEILHSVVAAALAGMGDIARKLDFALAALDPNQIVGQFPAEQRGNPLEPAGPGRSTGFQPVRSAPAAPASSAWEVWPRRLCYEAARVPVCRYAAR